MIIIIYFSSVILHTIAAEDLISEFDRLGYNSLYNLEMPNDYVYYVGSPEFLEYVYRFF